MCSTLLRQYFAAAELLANYQSLELDPEAGIAGWP
jgi:hypothetical protein